MPALTYYTISFVGIQDNRCISQNLFLHFFYCLTFPPAFVGYGYCLFHDPF
jgi:hypothetical protein